MQMPKNYRIAAASALLLVTASTLLLEHLHLISSDWTVAIVSLSTLSVCAIAAYLEYRSV
jgi:hypothetical protein